MKTFSLYTHYKKILADTITPVSIYLKIRDKFPNSILLESSDYHANDNSFSYICFNPIASIKVTQDTITETFPDGSSLSNRTKNVVERIHKFTKRFKVTSEEKFKFINNGIFGYTSYDAVKYFEDVEISKKPNSLDIPDIYYAVYQNIIAINHFKNEAYIFAHCFNDNASNIDIDEVLQSHTIEKLCVLQLCHTDSEISSNLTDDEYKAPCRAGKEALRSEVMYFQLVLSKEVLTTTSKETSSMCIEHLRSINPSPYLFYFDYGDFKIFGSSPEAQLVVNPMVIAEIHPIAGTFRRTGNDEEGCKSWQSN